jgi:adenosylhomocysteine nucleosidase
MTGMQLRGSVLPDLPLLVVALDEEAAGLDDRLPVLVTGPGKVCAATAVASTLAAGRPSAVINIGTAGALRSGLDGIHDIATVIQHDFDDDAIAALLGRRYGAPIELRGDAVGLTLATGDRFVSGGDLRDRLAFHADLVDMEGYAVAAAARAAGVPVRLVKLVSDEADEDAGSTWASTVADHARTLADWVQAHL